MPRWSMINCWTILVFISTLFVFSATLICPAFATPPAKKARASAKKRLPHTPMISSDMALLKHLPIAESYGFFRIPPDFEDDNAIPSFKDFHYRSALYVDAAVRLQAMSKNQACQHLLQLAKWEDMQEDLSGYRAIVLCRMLFVGRANRAFRPALTGGSDYFGGTADTDWPLEPIVLIDQVPFIISREYDGGSGQTETAVGYVQYCMDNCDWSSTVYHSLTQPQEEKALQKLYALPVWKGHLTINLKAYFAHQISPPN